MLSIHARQLYAGFLLPIMIFFAVGLVLFGQVSPQGVERLRLAVVGEMSPLYHVLVFPQKKIAAWILDLHGVTDLAAENTRLRDENLKLQHWYHTAERLEMENKRLKAVLHWGAESSLHYVSGRVIRDDIGPYLRAILLDVGYDSGIHIGSSAVDNAGLVGRVSELGQHVVRILLITDAASRIPVTMSSSGADAMMVGDNSETPRLMYYPQDHQPIEGEKVETRGQRGITGGVAVGYVHYLAAGRPVVILEADLSHLDVIRVFDSEGSLETPPADGRIRERAPLIWHGNDEAAPMTGLRGLQRVWPFTQLQKE